MLGSEPVKIAAQQIEQKICSLCSPLLVVELMQSMCSAWFPKLFYSCKVPKLFYRCKVSNYYTIVKFQILLQL
jgi:hypothetical protein